MFLHYKKIRDSRGFKIKEKKRKEGNIPWDKTILAVGVFRCSQKKIICNYMQALGMRFLR